jgi:hypothetical protein
MLLAALGDVGVPADYHRVLAAQFERHRHQVLRCAALDMFGDVGRSGEQ